MGDQDSHNEIPEWPEKLEPGSSPEFLGRHAAGLVLKDLDYDEQLAAINGMLGRHNEHSRSRECEIEAIEVEAKRSTGSRNDFLVDHLIGEFHSYTYEDGARSMAAVGMLAPFLESVFYHAFEGMRKIELPQAGRSHVRWRSPERIQWDCHYAWNDGAQRSSLVDGILQLADATQLKQHLPQNLEITLRALFSYRNMMFHNGLEWPMGRRKSFERSVAENGWPADWFESARRGGEPWIFYMSDAFIEHVLRTADAIIEGIAAFCNEHCLGPRPSI